MVEIKSCPFCGANLIKKEGRERGGDCYTYFDHPYNDCVLENLSVEDCEIEKWNKRVVED